MIILDSILLGRAHAIFQSLTHVISQGLTHAISWSFAVDFRKERFEDDSYTKRSNLLNDRNFFKMSVLSNFLLLHFWKIEIAFDSQKNFLDFSGQHWLTKFKFKAACFELSFRCSLSKKPERCLKISFWLLRQTGAKPDHYPSTISGPCKHFQCTAAQTIHQGRVTTWLRS